MSEEVRRIGEGRIFARVEIICMANLSLVGIVIENDHFIYAEDGKGACDCASDVALLLVRLSTGPVAVCQKERNRQSMDTFPNSLRNDAAGQSDAQCMRPSSRRSEDRRRLRGVDAPLTTGLLFMGALASLWRSSEQRNGKSSMHEGIPWVCASPWLSAVLVAARRPRAYN
mgnify:CR=1 FL=1